jgi:hypothetical protein
MGHDLFLAAPGDCAGIVCIAIAESKSPYKFGKSALGLQALSADTRNIAYCLPVQAEAFAGAPSRDVAQ